MSDLNSDVNAGGRLSAYCKRGSASRVCHPVNHPQRASIPIEEKIPFPSSPTVSPGLEAVCNSLENPL